MSFVDPASMKALATEETPRWRKGQPAVVVVTTSGSRYRIDTDGTATGGALGPRQGRLFGSVYRPGGPIRAGQVVVGLRLEIRANAHTYCTSVVADVVPA